MATTAQKAAWIVALVGLILLIAPIGPFGFGLFIGSYLLPLALTYLAWTSGKGTRYIGISAAMFTIAFILLWLSLFTSARCLPGPAGKCPQPGIDIGVFLINAWPSILLLIVSIYSLVRRK